MTTNFNFDRSKHHLISSSRHYTSWGLAACARMVYSGKRLTGASPRLVAKLAAELAAKPAARLHSVEFPLRTYSSDKRRLRTENVFTQCSSPCSAFLFAARLYTFFVFVLALLQILRTRKTYVFSFCLRIVFEFQFQTLHFESEFELKEEFEAQSGEQVKQRRVTHLHQ